MVSIRVKKNMSLHGIVRGSVLQVDDVDDLLDTRGYVYVTAPDKQRTLLFASEVERVEESEFVSRNVGEF